MAILGDPLGARGSWEPFEVLLTLAEGNGGRCDARILVRLLPTSFVKLRKLDVRNACSVSVQRVVCWSMALLLLMAPIVTVIASVPWSNFSLQCHAFLAGVVARLVPSPSLVFQGILGWTDVAGQLGWCAVAVEPVHHSTCPSVVSF